MKKLTTFIIALLAFVLGTQVAYAEATERLSVTLYEGMDLYDDVNDDAEKAIYVLTEIGVLSKSERDPILHTYTYSSSATGRQLFKTFDDCVQLEPEVGSDDDIVHVLTEEDRNKLSNWYRQLMEPYYAIELHFEVNIPVREGNLGTQGTWRFENGVLTVDYIGAMPISTKNDTNPETAFRLKWIDFLSEIKEVVVTGEDVEIQPYFLYYEGDGPSGSHPDDHIKKVTLSSGVKSIGRQALAIYDLKQLCCYGMTPPELASYNSSSIHCFWKARVEANKAFLVLLPGASVNYALANTEWMIFANVGGGFLSNLHPEDDPVGIKLIDDESLTPALSKGEGDWYDLSGRQIVNGTPRLQSRLGAKASEKSSNRKLSRGIYVNGGKKILVK